jgi:hypothetical protein
MEGHIGGTIRTMTLAEFKKIDERQKKKASTQFSLTPILPKSKT